MEDLVLSCLESRVEENRNLYARFLVGPFFKGDALTVATALRRVLLSSVESVAITALYIQGITHEFSSIVGVRESVLELSLNFQSVVLCYDKRFFQKNTFFDDTQIGYLQVQGPKVVYANDLKLPLGVKVVDPTQYIATISREGVLVLKFTLGKITNSPGQHTSLPTTKQAISQQLLKRNIVKAKTRCSYKKNYAVNPNLYCYSSIKRFVRAASSTAQLIGESCSTSYQPLGFANSMPSPLPLRSKGIKSSYKYKSSICKKICKKMMTNKSFGFVHQRTCNPTFLPLRSTGQGDVKRTYTKIFKPFVYTYKQNYKHKEQNDGVRGSENGASRTLAVKAVNKAKTFFNVNCYVQKKNLRLPFCRFKENGSNTKSSFFYNANNTKCKLIKPKKKEKGYTNHKCVGVTLPIGNGDPIYDLQTGGDQSPSVYKSKNPSGVIDQGSALVHHCKAMITREQSKADNQIKGYPKRSFVRRFDSLWRKQRKAFALQPMPMPMPMPFGQGQGQGLHGKRPCNVKLCKGQHICVDLRSSPLTKGHGHYKRQYIEKGDNFKSNYSFNKNLNSFRLIDNVFQSDICLHNIIPLDSSLSPVLKVNFLVEMDDEVLYLRQKVRERIILEVWTNGSIHPRQALHDATLSLLDIFSTFRSIYQTNEYSSTLLKVPEYNKKLKNN